MKLYGGIDLHSNNSVVAVTDEQDQVVYRKRLPNELDTILSVLEPYREYLHGLGVKGARLNFCYAFFMPRKTRSRN